MNEFIGKWRKFMVDGWENTLNEERYTPNEMSAMSIDKESSSGAFEEGIPDVNTDFSIDTDFGDLSEEEGVVNIGELASELEGQLGVKVIPTEYNEKGITIYPDKNPGDRVYTTDRTAQRIRLVFEDGALRLEFIFGYERGFDRLPFPPGRSSMLGFATYSPRSNARPKVSLDDMQMLIDQLHGGLEREAKAQADFYKDRQPD